MSAQQLDSVAADSTTSENTADPDSVTYDQAVTDLDDFRANPLQHVGPWLRTSRGVFPIDSVSPDIENNEFSASTYDDLRGIEIIGDEEASVSLAIGGRVQARYAFFRDQSVFENATSNQFELSRARLGFKGWAFEDYLRYRFGTDWSASGARLVDSFAEIDLQKAIGIGFGSSTRFRFGYWRTNFGRQAAESSQNMQFVDRSLTSNVFNIGNNTGIALLGGFTHWYRPVRYEFGVFNGFGTFGDSSRDRLDGNLGLSLRLTEELLGDYYSGESDNALSPLAALRVGGSVAYTRRTRRGVEGSTDEFDNSPAVLLVSDPENGDAFFRMDQLLGREQQYDLFLAGLELDCKHAGWSLHAEYLIRTVSNVTFFSEDTFSDVTQGFYLQGGYFVTEKTELALRHSTVYARGSGSGSPIGRDYHTTSNESGAGLNFYFRRHFSKLQMDLLYYDGVPINSSAMNLLAGDVGMLFRTQYQVAF